MHKVTTRFVRFYTPGLIVAETQTADVATLDPMAVAWPDNAYAFTLHERDDVVDGGETYRGEARQVGPMYYHPESRVMTAEEIAARNDPTDRILLSNMRGNQWPRVVYSRWGNWPQPYDAEKCVVLGCPR